MKNSQLKRKFTVALCLFSAIILSSCAPTPSQILSFQESDYTMCADIECGEGDYSVTISRSRSRTGDGAENGFDKDAKESDNSTNGDGAENGLDKDAKESGEYTLEVKFTKPETLSGYTFTLTPDGTILSYGDLSVPYHSDGFPGGDGLLYKLLSLKSECFTSSEEVTQNGMNLLRASFSCDFGNDGKACEVILYLNLDTSLPVRYEVPSENFIMSITDFS